MALLARFTLMIAMLGAGYAWVRPPAELPVPAGVSFVERASGSGCANTHTMPQLSPRFDNILPWLSSVGAAVAAGDYDADGDADLYVTQSGRGASNRLFRNRGDGTFEDVAASAGVACGNEAGACMHAIWGDIDNDGDLDLYVARWAAPNLLFRNDGGAFTDISRAAGVDYWGYGNAATFLDYDRDGRLDLLLGNYFSETVADPRTGRPARNDLWNPVSTRVMHETFTHARNGGRNVLYRNLGQGRFEDVTAAAGLTYTGWTLAVGAGDLNNDMWPDLYVANDFGPDECYLNTGATESPPRFRLLRDPRGHPGVGNDWWKGMNVDMADVNRDGYLDIYVTNILSRKYKTDEGNMLWLNCVDAACPGGRGFRNVALSAGTMDGGWGWAGKFADFDNDGLLDIFTVNGFVTGAGGPGHTYWYHIQEMVTQTKNQTADAADWPVMGDRDLSGDERSRLFIQVPPGKQAGPDDLSFVDLAGPAGITDTYNGRGIAIADFNRDGALDIYVANQGAPACYYVNQTFRTAGPRPGYLRLRLRGRPDLGQRVGSRLLASTADAVGARAVLRSSRGNQAAEVQGGMGFASQSEHVLHFGVPDPAALQGLTLRWPSGRTQEWPAETVRTLLNQVAVITEGGEPVVDR